MGPPLGDTIDASRKSHRVRVLKAFEVGEEVSKMATPYILYSTARTGVCRLTGWFMP